jgi:signal transduction histidine kinase
MTDQSAQPSESPPGAAAASQDLRHVSELYRMAAVGRLTASVIHEINTPIGSIRSNNEVVVRSLEALRGLLSEAIEKGTRPPEKAIEILETLISLGSVDKIACERISAVIRGLKTFARVNEGQLRNTDLNGLLKDTLKLACCEYRKRIQLVEDYGQLPEVECFPQLMNQVFLNLLVNAGQAIEGEGTVTVRTRAENGWAHVSISDTGRGILPEHRNRIFNAGFTTKPVGEGTGLGLAITREIVVDTHRGSITFDSEAGVGTTFHVRIPILHSRKRI